MRPRPFLLAIATSASILAGCHSAPQPPPPSTPSPTASLENAATDAQATHRPLAILVIDSTRSDADRTALAAFHSTTAKDQSIIPVVLDLTSSRNRAAAAPLHALDGPTLICQSPASIIISRDTQSITADLVRRRIDQAKQEGPQLDQELAQLNTAARANPNDVAARMDLAAFLLAHDNDQQALAPLDSVAHDQSADLPIRIQAWVAAGKAHLWIGEPEKARHSAQALIATLGPQSPDAIAGGNLVRGLQDKRAKRYDRAQDEFVAAVAASPASIYGKQARISLDQLKRGEK